MLAGSACFYHGYQIFSPFLHIGWFWNFTTRPREFSCGGGGWEDGWFQFPPRDNEIYLVVVEAWGHMFFLPANNHYTLILYLQWILKSNICVLRVFIFTFCSVLGPFFCKILVLIWSVFWVGRSLLIIYSTDSPRDHEIFLVVVGAGRRDDFSFHHETTRFISCW